MNKEIIYLFQRRIKKILFAERELTTKSRETERVSSAVKCNNTLITVIERVQINLPLHHNGKKSNHNEITWVKRAHFSRMFRYS